jgi:serine/threonine protein kinase
VETLELQADNGSKDSRTGDRESILPQGTILQDRYKVIKVVGLGGMGAVYQAQDLRFTGTKRLCALKEMISTVRDRHTRRIAVQNFEREANLLAALNHPAIPKIYDYFTEDVRNYLVLEFVEGMDLEAVLSSVGAPLPVDRVADWAIQICVVLSYLHHQTPAIMFRDLKPSNIMIRSPNQIVLIDFGIARVFRTEQKGTMIGTEGYSPPEQYRGTAKPEGDIYALGATLHHLLSRRDPRLHPPFAFHEESIRTLNPDVSD